MADELSYEVHRMIVNIIHDAGLTVEEFCTMHDERMKQMEVNHLKRVGA